MMPKSSTTTVLESRVYYEHTDAGGVVYHAKYLNFAAQGRSEFLRHFVGEAEQNFAEKHGVLFVVTKASIQFKKAATLDDLLSIHTTLQGFTPIRLFFHQEISVNQKLYTQIDTEIVCIDLRNHNPIKFPLILTKKLKGSTHD